MYRNIQGVGVSYLFPYKCEMLNLIKGILMLCIFTQNTALLGIREKANTIQHFSDSDNN